MDRLDGYIPIVIDPAKGTILLELPRDSSRSLLCPSMATGLGSNPIGIDRGEGGDCYVVSFVRAGERVLVVLENWSYRSSDPDNPALARAVRESFPPSTVSALPIQAETGGQVLVDATDLFLRDWLDVVTRLADAGQGPYVLARDRSTVYVPYTRAYPDNSEIDVSLTFQATAKAGAIVSRVAPDGRSFTLRQHVTLARLPDAGYRPRAHDPRMGYFGIVFKDYAQPINEQLERQWIVRHRLEREHPNDPTSPIRNPLVYYVDPGIPEPIRSATLEGARFWVEAFDRAGLQGAFKVELLPDGVDPMDIRYNVIQWENRNERGWSIGGALVDPRTGEAIKAMARMDSHRARTSYNLSAALEGATPVDTHFVLGRVRQVTAHEVGHTLGLAHNYIASTYDRGSVMDYPGPRVRIDSLGRIDASQAYALGPGPWDVLAVRWGYGIFPAGSERDSLAAIVREGLASGLIFLSDNDARPESGSDPRVNLWDDAPDASAFLRHQMEVRRVAMASFGLGNLGPGEPVALLQERFAPLYFFHRFAVFSLAKAVGGVEYQHAVNGDGQFATRPVPANAQRAALHQLLGTLTPAALAIPDTVLTLLGPRPFGYDPTVELLGSRTRPVFDDLEAARTLAAFVYGQILQRDRAARLVRAGAEPGNQLTLPETIDALLQAALAVNPPGQSAKFAALQRVTQRALVDQMLQLAADKDASPDVRAVADLRLAGLERTARIRSAPGRGVSEVDRAHWLALANDIHFWLDERTLPASTVALKPPPGDPFGDEGEEQ